MTTEVNKKPVSVYQQLSGILNALKSEEITLNDAMNKIQLKESNPTRPYCKVTSSGVLALYGITKQPIVMYADQWSKLLKITKSNYIENYISYNHDRLKYKTNTFNQTTNPINNNYSNKKSSKSSPSQSPSQSPNQSPRTLYNPSPKSSTKPYTKPFTKPFTKPYTKPYTIPYTNHRKEHNNDDINEVIPTDSVENI